MMRKLLIAAGAIALMGATAGCAGYGDHRAYGYEGGGAAVFDAYYDDAYGPFYDGYWGSDGFYFSRGRGQPFARDDGGHFRREAFNGFHGVHGRGGHAGAGRH